MNLDLKKIKYAFLAILAVEAVSFLGYLYPVVNKIGFLLIVLIALAVSVRRLEFGLWLMFAELFIGSKGYLFYFDLNGLNLSIRIALWLVVMSVWLAGLLTYFYRNRSIKADLSAFIRKIRQGSEKYLAILSLFILWGVVDGAWRGNDYANIFFDFNNWLYFLLLFPLFSAIDTEKKLADLFSILAAAIAALTLKTLALLFIFSHELSSWIYPLYRWVRTTGVGEITQVQGGFYRIFFQSHIFELLGFFVVFSLLIGRLAKLELKFLRKDKFSEYSFAILTLLLSVILLSFSRSFWIGLAAGLFMLLPLAKIFFPGVTGLIFKKTITAMAIFSAAAILGVLLIVILVKFPYPHPLGGFDTSDLFSDRLTKTNEAALSSRWELLPKLMQEIGTAPLFGRGFGTLVTYQSFDPRLTALPSKGIFTTYAFEWGWLDIWLKLGIFGLLTYLLLIATIIRDIFFKLRGSSDFLLYCGLGIGLAVLAVVNFFTPYLNHPLGIGYLLLTLAAIRLDPLLKSA
jgi:hypothetical protein